MNSNEKICTRCSCAKKKADFCRSRGNNPQYEHSTCNKCCEKRKNTRKEIDPISRKKTKLEANWNASVPSISTMSSQTSQTIFSDLTNLELDDNSNSSEKHPNDNDNTIKWTPIWPK